MVTKCSKNLLQLLVLTLILHHRIRQRAVIWCTQIWKSKQHLSLSKSEKQYIVKKKKETKTDVKIKNSPKKTLPCEALKAGCGDDRPRSSRSWKANSWRRFSFFSSRLHCSKRLFFTALLRRSSSQSLRAASKIFIWSANSASTKLSSESCCSQSSRALYISLREQKNTMCCSEPIQNVSYTFVPCGILWSSNLNAAPIRLRICGGFSPGSRG